MDYNSCLLDTNIIIDEILERDRLDLIVKNIFTKYDFFFISAKTFSTVFYLLRKHGFAKEKIFNRLEKYKIVGITEDVCIQGYKWAKNSADVEDCMELAIAYFNDMIFVTADKELAQKYCDVVDVELV